MIARKALLAGLAAFAPEGEAERASLERVRALVASAPDPFTRSVRDHVTASALIARPDGTAFLLVHHRRLDRWLQPGGHVEPEDESIFAAALREAREETGISSFAAPLETRILDVDVHPIPAAADRPEHVHFDVRHLVTTTEEGGTAAPEEVRGVRWFPLEEALREADESLQRALGKAARALSATA